MALPMVHLLAARKWVRAHEEFNTDEFYLGVISPDAIHIRDGDDKSRKNEIHLNNWGSIDQESVIEYWRKRHSAFDIGYGIHVLTDGQWVPRFRARLKGMLLPDGRLNTDVYYNDAVQTDIDLFRQEGIGDRLFEQIKRAVPPENHPLLTGSEIGQWPGFTLKLYYEDHSKLLPARFVTMEYVLDFIDDCQKLLEHVYGRYCNE